MKMHNVPHPGEVIREIFLSETDLSEAQIAKKLNVGQSTFNRLVQGKSAVTPIMAVKLSEVLGSTPKMWLTLQANYDLSLVDVDAVIQSLSKVEFKRPPKPIVHS